MKSTSEYKSIIKQNKQDNMPYPDICCDGDEVVRIVSSENESGDRVLKGNAICRRIQIEEIRSNIHTLEKTCVLKYIDDAGKETTKEVARDVISDNKKVVELSKYGLDITSDNASDVVEHFRNEKVRASKLDVVTNVGILKHENRFVFIGGRSICIDEESKKARNAGLKYEGRLDIRARGDLNAYKAMLASEVVPSTPLSAALAVGASSLLVGYIGSEIHIPNILAHLSGDSSTGKSTALQLAVSVFGGMDAANGKTSLFTSWNSTDNALQEMMAGNCGIAVGLDELGMKQAKNFASMIYRLVEGKEKQRMKFGEGNMDVREWHTAIISTGEQPMEDDADQATGQKVRLIHFESVMWTKDAEQSDRVKDCLSQNYGLLGEPLAVKLLSHPQKFWVKKHRKEAEKIAGSLDCGKLSRRIAKLLALVMLSAHMLRWSDIEIDANAVRKFLVDSTNQTCGKSSSIGERAYERFLAEISRNQNKVELRKRNGSPLLGVPAGEVWGTALAKVENGGVGDWEHVNVPAATVEAFLKENGFNNPNIIFKEWARSGRIVPSSDKLFHKIKIGKAGNVKCLRFPL